jgi:hypothetical protein
LPDRSAGPYSEEYHGNRDEKDGDSHESDEPRLLTYPLKQSAHVRRLARQAASSAVVDASGSWGS